MDFSWQDVSVTVNKTGLKILDGVWGCAKPGEMLAIMGPSGSGKTTMLNALAGRSDGNVTVGGRVLVNGKPKDRKWRRIHAFVPQEPSLMGVLTVKETLNYAAAFAGANTEQRSHLITDSLAELGMSHCEETRVGDVFFKGISGGQKKRLSIGVELMKQPSLVLLDEPTSGLDSAAAFQLCQRVSELAASGRTVVATIHQPSAEVLNLFDKVLLMARGKTVYYGPVSGMVEYFAAQGYPCPQYTNPADFCMNVINTDFPGHGDLDAMWEHARGEPLEGIKAEVTVLD
jgi:ABC-type multidrug transport system ATPase subunit